jgi:hypothetical protein
MRVDACAREGLRAGTYTRPCARDQRAARGWSTKPFHSQAQAANRRSRRAQAHRSSAPTHPARRRRRLWSTRARVPDGAAAARLAALHGAPTCWAPTVVAAVPVLVVLFPPLRGSSAKQRPRRPRQCTSYTSGLHPHMLCCRPAARRRAALHRNSPAARQLLCGPWAFARQLLGQGSWLRSFQVDRGRSPPGTTSPCGLGLSMRPLPRRVHACELDPLLAHSPGRARTFKPRATTRPLQLILSAYAVGGGAGPLARARAAHAAPGALLPFFRSCRRVPSQALKPGAQALRGPAPSRRMPSRLLCKPADVISCFMGRRFPRPPLLSLGRAPPF